MLALSGCGGAADDVDTTRTGDRSGAIDPAAYAGDVVFKIAETFVARETDVPFVLFLGLRPEAETRFGANAFLDLRDLQDSLPELLTGTFDPSCSLGLDIGFERAEATGDTIRARANVTARLHRCVRRGTENEGRGMRLLTQVIDLDATVSGSLEGECVAFRLVDLDLAPRGLLGGLATLFGVTERVRGAILEQARSALSENPVCPDLPGSLAALDPSFAAFGLREIGDGGIGAALAGSVDLRAETLLALLAEAAERAREPGAKARLVSGEGGRVDMRIDDTINAKARDIPFGLDARLSAVAPTRIGIEATLDLREVQRLLPDMLADEVLVDNCGGRVSLKRLEADATGARVIAKGRLALERFDCERTGAGSWQRGELLRTEEVGVRADLSAEVLEGCVVFRLLDLQRDPPGALAQLETGSGRSAAARALLMEAVALILEDNPLCPELPPELTALDTSIYRGEPQEMGDGGLGIALDGSIDVSARTIVDLLRLLQARGAVPPAP